ncbi:hypothetical protein QVA66_08535 [Staphylococcus chromogenes]|nr:hypothetical protein [Staphylococcus chromogenes]
MIPVRITSRLSALLCSRAAKVCAIVVCILLPVAWMLFYAQHTTAPGLLRDMYTVGLGAPIAGIAVAVLGLLSYVVKHRKTCLRIDDHVQLPHSGVRFPTPRLRLVQLFSFSDRSFVALLPDHVSERLTVGTIASGRHSVANYIVEFPQWPNMQTYELAEALQEKVPGLEVQKIGSVSEVAGMGLNGGRR